MGHGGWAEIMATWRKEEEDAPSHHQEKRDGNGIRKIVMVQASVELSKLHQLA